MKDSFQYETETVVDYADENLTSVSSSNVSNATLATLYDDDTNEVLNTFNDILGVGITGSLCLLGVAGNALTFIVLQRSFCRSPMFYVLRMLSLSDGIFLLTVFTLQTVVNLYHLTSIPSLGPPFFYRGHIQYFVWPWLMTTQMTTVWLTVLVSCERFVAICYPLRAAYICTITKVRYAVISILVASIVFNVPRFLEFTPEYDSPMQKTDTGMHSIYRYLYTCALYSVVLFLLPLILLLFLNVMLVVALQRGRKQWQHLQSRQKREQNLTVIPLTIVVVFFVCGTPSLVVNIVDSVYPELFTDNPAMIAFMVFANFLVVVNSASNIFVYFLLGKTFRSRLFELLCCSQKRLNQALSAQYRSTDRPDIHTEASL